MFQPQSVSKQALEVANTIERYNVRIKELNAQLKKLRQQKQMEATRLYKYMAENGIEQVGTITKKSIQPKIRVTEEAKRAAAIDYLARQGVDNPAQFYQLYKATQTKSYIFADGEPEQTTPSVPTPQISFV